MAKDLWVEKFQREVVPLLFQEFKPSKVFIFGSRIKGNATANSDLDVIVVSDHFNTVPFIKRMTLLSIKARFPKHVDYLCYTPEEFERVKISSAVIQDALQMCQEVVP
jgi:predicted nucleotidyltransferase